ncbi:deleted in malignant brain tumors 1 protein-like, partial [Emydura macquarii macquarii]|uniref:deleted in malignant brain tumors 1 protein-like n=1 Tax=Emydura macquarii macquarii TaxID=1129001 RepID=UPI00352B3B43
MHRNLPECFFLYVFVDSGISEVAQIRLVNSPSRCSGRVEVLHNDQWGTVCDDNWDLIDAGVVCRQLGCGRASSAPGGARFGRGSGRIWLDDVHCTGTETSLTECRARPWGNNNCHHGEDAGVVCSEAAQLRLVNGSSRCAGRVEVLHNQQWGTVCDVGWDLRDAGVVCQQLGCGTVLSAPGRAHFGQGSDRIWLDEVNCTGTEAALSDCRARPWGDSNCTHREDAGVNCSVSAVPEQTTVRLVNGPSRCIGRVEVLHNDQWGTVCDDIWDITDAGVVCRQLGCGRASSAPGAARFGPGSGLIWLDDVHCTGTEAALTECRAKAWGNNNCHHGEDAGVVCSDSGVSEAAQLRLVNGSSRCAGRVEVLHNEKWGTVCDVGWDLRDAGVVCQQLGCGTALSAPGWAHFGQGSDRIWLDEVNCTGTEAALSDCRARPWGDSNCTHGEDAGVNCSDSVVPERTTVRLVNGPSRCAGRVEVFHNDQWGTVCDDNWDLVDAGVVCRQLGCERASLAPGGARFGRGSDRIWLDDVHCTGREAGLTECRAKAWGVHNCHHGEDAGVVCSDSAVPEQITVRLVNGPGRCSGRVEVLHNDQWGTVCDDNWDITDAGVVCRQLGCGRASSAPGGARFGQGSGRIWMDDVECRGTEAGLTECRARPWGSNNCNHGEDAGVVCSGISEAAQLRLVNGSSRCAGRVEVLHNQQWGTVCDVGWDLRDAGVVCQQLGCGTALSAPGWAHFGQGSDRIWLDEVNCTGTEAALSDCRARPWGDSNCTHREDAGVNCSDSFVPEQTTVRLVNGPSRCAGRVEVLYNGQWGTVCDDNWDLIDAGVVCRQLGCGTASSAPGAALFGRGSELIWLDDVECRGTEASLTECRARPWGNNNCNHGEDAGVVCSDSVVLEQTAVRLVNGSSRCAGRVEVFHSDQWGTVCHDNWDITDAGVVCRQLGCGTALSAPGGARFGRGSDRIWLDDVHCTGTEAGLSECRARPWGVHNCHHGEDAGVVCSGIKNADHAHRVRDSILGGSDSEKDLQVMVDNQLDVNTHLVYLQSPVSLNTVETHKSRQFPCSQFPESASPASPVPQGATFPVSLAIRCTGTSLSFHSLGVFAGSAISEVAPLRLVNGPNRCTGRVEVLHNQEWGSVCHDNWGFSEAEVVCRQLACGTALSAPHGAHFGQASDRMWLDDVQCTGTEAALSQCRARPWGDHNCDHGEDASVVCSAQGQLQLRLASGPSPCSGRVEVLINNTWGAVCDAGWGLPEAGVVCKQMGCGVALSAPGLAQFGHGAGDMWLEGVSCTGQESLLTECRLTRL